MHAAATVLSAAALRDLRDLAEASSRHKRQVSTRSLLSEHSCPDSFSPNYTVPYAGGLRGSLSGFVRDITPAKSLRRLILFVTGRSLSDDRAQIYHATISSDRVQWLRQIRGIPFKMAATVTKAFRCLAHRRNRRPRPDGL